MVGDHAQRGLLRALRIGAGQFRDGADQGGEQVDVVIVVLALKDGRDPLLKLRARGPRSRLVGFQLVEDARVPPEGCQVVDAGKPVGRLTSTRFSPTLGRSLGLAWLPATNAAVGERFAIRWNSQDVPAVVVPLPFYDPQGKRLRS